MVQSTCDGYSGSGAVINNALKIEGGSVYSVEQYHNLWYDISGKI